MGWQVHYCSSPGESKWSPTYDCFLPPTGPIYLTTPGHKTTIPSFLDKHKNNNNKKSSTSSIIIGSLTVMRMAQRDTNQSKKKINNKEFKQPQPWRPQCKKKKWFYDQNNCSALAPRFLLHLWRPLHDYNVKPSNVIFYGGRYKDESFLNLFLKPDEVLKNSTPWEITYIW